MATTEFKPVPPVEQRKCRACASPLLQFREWTSFDEAHEDVEYRCLACSKHWWVEGVDS